MAGCGAGAGNTVMFCADGINDLAALRAADIRLKLELQTPLLQHVMRCKTVLSG